VLYYFFLYDNQYLIERKVIYLERSTDTLLRLLSPVAVIVVGLALFLITLQNPFTSDDVVVTSEAPQLYNLAYLPKIFLLDLDRPVPPAYAESFERPSRTGLYRPVLVLTYMFDAYVWDNQPFGWRLTSLILHLLAALAVLGLARQLTGSRPAGLVAALFFVAHPIHTEAVAMLVGGRSELLACIFVVLAWRIFIKGDQAKGLQRWKLDALSAGIFLLGLWSKENAAMLLGIIFLYGWAMKFQPIGTILKRLIPHMLVLLIYISIRLLVIGRVAPTSWSVIFGDASAWHIITTVATILLYYLKLVFLPYPLLHQTCYLQLPDTIQTAWAVLSLLSLVGLISLAVWAVCRGRARGRPSIWAFCLLLFYLCLVPVSHIVPFWVLMAERFLYLPSFAFCLALGFAARHAYQWRSWLAYLVLTPLLAFFCVVTVQRNLEWFDLDLFWGKVAKYAPNMHGPVSLMGSARLRQGQPEQAIELFKKAIVISPGDAAPRYNLGRAYQEIGKTLLAEQA